jgi:spore coat polysaccharide biosynthesis protein SpsF (cytidylyltransferase family)
MSRIKEAVTRLNDRADRAARKHLKCHVCCCGTSTEDWKRFRIELTLDKVEDNELVTTIEKVFKKIFKPEFIVVAKETETFYVAQVDFPS